MLSKGRRQSLELKSKALAENVDVAQSYLDTRGISAEVASMFLLGCVPSDQEFAGRLSIPYLTPSGVVQIKYRCADLSHFDHKNPELVCAKYLYEAGCGTHLYNARVLIGASELVVVTEGELDAICVQAYCGIPAVAYPGVTNWQSWYRLCFDGVDEVVVVADGDEVGRETALKVAHSIGSAARVVDLGDGEDSNKYIHERGHMAFQERLMQ